MVEIRQEDLRFSPDECADFLRGVMGLDLSAEDVAALERRTEGWIAGLQLAALSMQGSSDLRAFVRSFAGDSRYILDYLIEEVFERQPAEVQEFMLKTSILERLSALLCDAVTERVDSQGMLLQLEQANLFVVPLDQSREWYRYHRLFAELLRQRLRTSGTYQEVRLHMRACQWYETNGFMSQAVHHALAGGDWNEAGRVISLAASQTIQNGQLATLHGWIEALPDAHVRKSLDLATIKGWTSLMMGELEAAGVYAELAEGLLPADTPPGSQAPLSALRASLALARQDVASAIERSKKTLELIDEQEDYFLRGMALNNLAQAHMMVGDLPAATATYRQMVRLSQKAGHSPTTISALANLAALLHQGGKRREAVALCLEALEHCVDGRGRPLPLAGYVHVPMGVLCYEANDLTLARQHLLKGVEFGEYLGALTGVALSGMIALAQLQQAAGEADAALATIGKTRQLASQYNLSYVDFQVAGVEADILMKQGNLSWAGRWAETAGVSSSDMPNPIREGNYFTYARLLLAQNQLNEADTLLANFEQFARNGGRQRSLITVYILQALLHQVYGNGKQALNRLGMALDLAAPEGYRRAFLDEGQPVIDLLPKARHLAPGFVDQLLSDAQAEPDIQMPSPLVQPLVEPLSDRELEVLRLLSDGLSNREIAERLVIGVGTVKTHLHNIYGKLEVRGRAQAVHHAKKLDLI
jgi:LuxR family maltose regulon positive regulatory protein